jgi:hypothetical protein
MREEEVALPSASMEAFILMSHSSSICEPGGALPPPPYPENKNMEIIVPRRGRNNVNNWKIWTRRGAENIIYSHSR